MEKSSINNLRNVGASISSTEASFLREAYETRFPSEKKNLLVRKEIIQQVISQNPGLCGIRFMYGMTDANDASGKLLMLAPCFEKQGIPSPQVALNADGYYSSEGSRTSLIETWEYFNNYVVRARSLEPNLLLRQVSRNCYFGINTLTEIIQNEETAYINYHFGYDENVPAKNMMQRYRVVLESLDNMQNSLEIYFDHGGLLPCVPGDPTCCTIGSIMTTIGDYSDNVEEDLDVFRKYRDNVLLKNQENGRAVEMYYHISPLIVNKINAQPNKKQLYQELFDNYLEKGRAFIENGNAEEARMVFESTMQQLMKQYLLN